MQTVPTRSSLTDCGLPGIRQIPYGVHMCQFYDGPEELAAALVPYFIAGLRANERCIWVCAEPLPAVDAKARLAAAGVDVDAALASGALILRDFSEWYAESSHLKGLEVVKQWLEAEERALAEGYQGIRITGNVTFLTPDTWSMFMDYEKAVDQAFNGRRIVTLCTYPRAGTGAAEVAEVLHRHSCALEHPDEGWQILTAAR